MTDYDLVQFHQKLIELDRELKDLKAEVMGLKTYIEDMQEEDYSTYPLNTDLMVQMGEEDLYEDDTK